MNQLDLGLENLGSNGQEERRPGLQAVHPPWEPLRFNYVLLQWVLKIIAT